jgi:hypothetical protein
MSGRSSILDLMIVNTEQVVAAALELSREERAAVVEELLRSLDDAEDLLDAGDRARLHAAIVRSDEQFRAGRGIPAETVLDRLNKR